MLLNARHVLGIGDRAMNKVVLAHKKITASMCIHSTYINMCMDMLTNMI